MTTLEADNIAEIIETEGFVYTFIYYSVFNEIEDAEFHRLREEYITAFQRLQEYIEKSRSKEALSFHSKHSPDKDR